MERMNLRREKHIIAALAILGGLRITFMSVGLPFWNNVDEKAHADMVLRYAKWQIPVKMEHYSPESASLIVACDCKEYLLPREYSVRYHPPASAYQETFNLDSEQPPGYYALAGAWYRIGQAIGLDGCPAMKWVRALNGVFFGLLLLVAGALARKLYPGDRLIGLGTPLLLMAMPQDLFYSINSDVPSALLCTSALLCLPSGKSNSSRWIIAGLLASLALLTKYSNIGVLAGGIVAGWWAWRNSRNHKPVARGLIIAGVAVSLPVLLWLIRNALVLGDPIGMRDKLAWLSWTPLPWSSLFEHPLFTLKGAGYFLGELARRGWRGEMVWHGLPMVNWLTDAWFTWSTGLFLIAAAFGCFRNLQQKQMGDIVNSAVLLVSIAFLVWTSLAWDFGTCPYPSREMPFMVSARLISGGLASFLMLYLRGFQRLCPPNWGFRTRFTLICFLAAIMLVSDLIIRWPALFIN